MLKPFGPEIWIAEEAHGPVVAGFRYSLRMTVIRLSDGGLVLWSPIPPGPGLQAAVAGLGPVTHIVAPNTLHHLSVADWVALCPEAQVLGVPGLARKRRDITFDGMLDGSPVPGWRDEIDHVLIRGNLLATEAILFHRASGTVLVTDMIQNFPDGWFRGWRAGIARLDRMTGAGPAMPRKFRAAFLRRRPARAAVETLLDWPAERLVIAHGTPVERDVPAALEEAFGWLAG